MNYNLRTVRRGSDPRDNRWFSKESVLKLQKAQAEVSWLLDRGYKMHSIIEMVGNHYQFSLRQRNALQRSTSSKASCKKRKSKCLPFSCISEDCIYIDGFNLIITLEVALSKGILILCNDSTIRDIAGLRGTYSIVDKTHLALNLIGQEFTTLGIPKVKFFLDSGVSNSGRLKNFILEHSIEWNIPVEIELIPNADPLLSKMGRIVTSDSIVLDSCLSWFNIARKIIEDYVPDANIINLSRDISSL
ncbi:DUF434 domain-containing protein [Clostridium ljungdahlii]|uniref:DUF434 domain-containing protein n=1 Tax=Clostridium ljungdahlii TaxID=1538 RepID=A0A166S850_9CLOT|nr:DUF434 domain-containing protein [Clostridium ljungdahlii]OAA91788.1 hypothetical protein WY13_00432 [Clostridium ljungdahlii]